MIDLGRPGHARLRDPSSGSVSIDGIALTAIGEEALAAIVGVVTQGTYLVHDTIRANLLLARTRRERGAVVVRSEAAQVADLIGRLPEGLDTVVGSVDTASLAVGAIRLTSPARSCAIPG
ncbi:MAG: hypothetical protein U0Q10_06490 [Dermatophilaceae bacterium]